MIQAKPCTIAAQVTTPEFTVRLNYAHSSEAFTVEAETQGELEAFLRAIGMDSEKRMKAIEGPRLFMDWSDFAHALKCLVRLV